MYSFPNVIRVIKSRRMIACMREMKSAYKIGAGKREGMKTLGRRRRQECITYYI
jgi:hypothetical protein